MFSFHHPRPVVSRQPVAELSVRQQLTTATQPHVLVAKAGATQRLPAPAGPEVRTDTSEPT